MIEAFLEREFNSLLVALAHLRRPDDDPRLLDGGQFFTEKAYVLLVFAGIWALMEGINDIVRAFAIWGLHEEVSGGTATEGSHT